MNDDALTLGRQRIRGTDSNSLLRLYDRACEIFNTSPLLQERSRAGKAMARIALELRNRNVRP